MIARRIIRVNGKLVREFSMAHYEALGQAARLKNLAHYEESRAVTQALPQLLSSKRCIGCGATVTDAASHHC